MFPSTGHVWSIVFRSFFNEELHVVGIDTGIREIVVAVDQDDPKGGSPVRYTQQQRLRDLRSRQYADEGRRTKPCEVAAAEQSLANHNSRSAGLRIFCDYCHKRDAVMEECLAFYVEKEHRRWRWKTYIKMQQSEERLYDRLRAIRKKEDPRRLVGIRCVGRHRRCELHQARQPAHNRRRDDAQTQQTLCGGVDARTRHVKDVLQMSWSVRAVERGGRGEKDQDSGACAHLAPR